MSNSSTATEQEKHVASVCLCSAKLDSPGLPSRTIRSLLPLRHLDRVTCQRVYLDTFDWRLYGAGLLLEAELCRGSRRLLLRDRVTQDELAVEAQVQDIAFYWQLPRGALRTAAEPLLN